MLQKKLTLPNWPKVHVIAAAGWSKKMKHYSYHPDKCISAGGSEPKIRGEARTGRGPETRSPGRRDCSQMDLYASGPLEKVHSTLEQVGETSSAQ